MNVARLSLLLVLALLVWPDSAEAQASRSLCADCHFARGESADRQHIDDWSASLHGQADVGCERCHGGNATTLERFAAHQGILRSSNPSSPVHRANLPRTCGTCHSGPFVAFQKSEHFKLLNEGDGRGPTCTTCHDSVAARLVSPRGLEQRCLQCHGPNAREPREGRAAEARAMLQGISEVRESIRAANRLIGRIADPARRRTLEEARQQAEVPLTQARDAGHQFEFGELQARLANARERAAALMQLLINPR
jgi:hypothetical protein